MRQSLHMLARDWRSGELRVLALALVIAVASVSSVAFLGDRVSRAIVRDAHQLLGADLVLLSDHPWNEEFTEKLTSEGMERAEGVSFMSMAIGKDKRINGTPTIVFENGDRIPGAMPIADFEKKLAEAKAGPATASAQ